MIPQGDTLKAARVEADGFYARLVAPWLARVRFRRRPLCLALTRAEQLLHYVLRQRSAFDMRAGPGSPRLHGGSINPSRLTVDFFHDSSGHRPRSLPVVRNNPCSAPSALRLHPEHPKTTTVHSSSQWLEPIAPRENENILSLRAYLLGDDYVWQRETSIPASTNRAAVHFRQSTFDGAAYSQQSLHRHAMDHVPVLSQTAGIDL